MSILEKQKQGERRFKTSDGYIDYDPQTKMFTTWMGERANFARHRLNEIKRKFPMLSSEHHDGLMLEHLEKQQIEQARFESMACDNATDGRIDS